MFVKTTHDETTDSPAWRAGRGEREYPTCVTGTWGTEYFGVGPAAGDIEVVKHRYSAFIHTDLELRLRAMGVEATMRDGFMLDFYVVLLKDCTTGEQTAYEHTLKTMARGWGWISDSYEVSALLDALPRLEAELPEAGATV